MVLFIFVFGGILAVVGVLRQRAKKLARLRASIRDEIEFNALTLRVKRIQMVIKDDFGTVQFGKWIDAKKYYLETRIQPLVSGAGYLAWPKGLADEVEDLIEQAAAKPPPEGAELHERFVSSPEFFDPRMNPIDYEVFCALQLRKAGWDAQTTVATGDQGADVIATHAGKKLVVQCKLYSGPIGNDAVQQVHAAKTFQSAQLAAVVSNQPFTRSAKQLASVNNVYLLHHDELSSFRPIQVRA
jgi:restriction system protein